MIKKRNIIILTYILFTLPLILYPKILLVNLIALTIESLEQEGGFSLTMLYSFITVSTLYPITYIFSLVFFNIKGKLYRKLWVLLSPAIHLILTVVLMLILFTFGGYRLD